MSKLVEFKVSLPLPVGATLADAQEYILEAVQTWRGQLRPPSYDEIVIDDGHPMYYLNYQRVKVTRIRRPKP